LIKTQTKIQSAADLEQIKQEYNKHLAGYKRHILVCGGASCTSAGCQENVKALKAAVEEFGIADNTIVIETGCKGTCAVGPTMSIHPDGVFYTKLTPEACREIVSEHLCNGRIVDKYTFFDKTTNAHVAKMENITFFNRQVRVALRNYGVMEHTSIVAYIARDGYKAAAKALAELTSADVVAEVKKSGLMGRGGGGFPTGVKWEAGLNAPGDTKYIICNADEGDPGAFMDRSILEGDPHSVIEGMLLGGFAIGAHMGYVYVRAEYPLAIERLSRAISQAREYGLLGKDIFGSGYDFDLEIRIGAGAFVCGEETAMMNSLEGQRGEPRQKPPFPFQKGLFGYPTIINNVETFANIPAIIYNGAEWFAAIGTKESKGTKVFALAGDIANTGIVEVPIGISLGDLLFDIGGGVAGKKHFKAAQMGGPSGGCVTQKNLNTPVDYRSLKELGAIMGSGGVVVMNEDTCMVDTARFFMEFIQDESCGQCVPCRLGTQRMLEILTRITQGKGEEGDIELLETLGEAIKETSICGLGQTAPNPVLSAIKNFREEFEEHIKYKKCRAGVCSELFISPCENTCPANINVPGYTALIAEGRFIDAYKLIRQENPFPSVCGRICTHPCESKCRRRTTDEAIAICDLKRFAADYAHKNELPFTKDIVFPKNGKRVSVIGAGAAGLTCGYYLARIGYDVDVYEAENVAGGVLAYGIPEYRLPKSVLQHEISLIEKEGVDIHLNTAVGKEISFETLQKNSDAIFVSTGTQLPQKVGIEGENLKGVVHGIDFLKTVNLKRPFKIGENVVVIGGGNTAIDSARTALRLGAKKVTILYRRTRNMMPANENEINEAIEEGIELIELVQPVRFVSGGNGRVCAVECQSMTLGEFDSTGRRKSVPSGEQTYIIETDMVIPAISQYADLPFIPAKDVGRTQWGTFKVNDDTMMTTIKGVFAGGDIVRGPDTVIQAIADGKKAASAIDKYLGGQGVLNKGEPIEINFKYNDDEIVELPRYSLDMLSMDKRRNSFDEVVLGYHRITAMAEAMRCLHCERRG